MQNNNRENCSECNNRFRIWFNKIVYAFKSETKLISEQEAYESATYGKCMNREQYVLQKQLEINAQIRDKIDNLMSLDTDFEKYFLVISFNQTEEECSKEIFQPFKEKGYTIERMTEKIDLLANTNVYLMTWRKNISPQVEKVEK